MQLLIFMKHKSLQITGFFILGFFTMSYVEAQRISGYFPNYNYSVANNTGMQYQKMTHLYYFSLNPVRTAAGQSSGALWYNDTYSWFTTTSFNAVVDQARAVNPNIKILLVTGGAPGNDTDLNARLNYIAGNASRLNFFCNNICSFIKANNLDGWDLDWEFPTDAAQKNNHEAMLAKMRQKIDSMKTADCKHYEITIAVGGGYTTCSCWNPCDVTKVNANVINYLDIVNIMAYDGATSSAWDPSCSYPSHQHYNRMVKALTDWTAAFPSWPKAKLALGVGFYDNPVAVAFRSGGNNSTWYNQTYWGNGGGSGCPNMQAKIDYARTQGTAGIFIWELTQDNLCTGTVPACYSLLDCIYQYTTSSWGTWTSPSPPCSLPVVLTEFTGNKSNENAVLFWTTSLETNHDYFILRGSSDGISFSDVAIISGKGNTSDGASYSYTDAGRFNYYQLVITSIDGKKEYSKIISLGESQFIASLHPNPFDHGINLVVVNSGDENIKLKVYNSTGKEIMNREVNPGDENITMGEEWVEGIYLVNLVSSYEVKSYKVKKE